MNNEIQQMSASNEVDIFNSIEKPYKLRKLKATELFPILNILKKIGFKKFTELLQNKETKDIIENLKKGEMTDNSLVGIGTIAFEFAQIILDGAVTCENELFKVLSNISGLTINEVEQLDLEIIVLMIIDLIKENVDFFKAVSKYLK